MESDTSQIVNEWLDDLPDVSTEEKCPCNNSQCSWVSTSSESDNDTQVSFTSESNSDTSFFLNYSESEETGWSTSDSETESEFTQVSELSTCEDLESELSIHGDTDSEESDLEGFLSETDDDPLWANDEDPDWTP